MVILQAAAIAMALSVDAFAASFAYGSNKIKIPMRSVLIIDLICSCTTGISLLAGAFLLQYIPGWLTSAVSFAILFILGLVKLLDSITKTIIRRHSSLNKEVHFSLFNFRFILTLYSDPEKADIDNSKILAPGEAASLAVALSLDGIAVGLGAALAGISVWAIFASSLLANVICLLLGSYIGDRVARKIPFNLSWLSGCILILMAITKII